MGGSAKRQGRKLNLKSVDHWARAGAARPMSQPAVISSPAGNLALALLQRPARVFVIRSLPELPHGNMWAATTRQSQGRDAPAPRRRNDPRTV
jgi:hypothetical protein